MTDAMTQTPRTAAFLAKEPRIFRANVGDREREAIELMESLERELATALEKGRREGMTEAFEQECADIDSILAPLNIPRTEGGRLQVTRIKNTLGLK